MRPGLIVALFSICGLAATLASRSVDPLVSLIALDFGVPTTSAALVTSLYALPFALGQPILGPLGDTYGKVRMLRVYLWILAFSLTASAFSPTLHSLFFLRLCSGLAAGGIIPACMASLGDRFAGPERSVAISRFVTVGLMVQILGASLSGVLASVVGWRPIFLAAGLVGAMSALAATFFLQVIPAPRQIFSFRNAAQNYRSVFRNAKAPLCYGTVFLEGLALFGIMPFVAEILKTRSLGGAAEAGLIIGCLGVGGIIYSVALPYLLRRTSRHVLLGAGGLIASAAPLALAYLPTWHSIAAGFAVGGFGYMLMHNSIQSESVELAPHSRVSAYSLHAFSFFTGQSLGPLFAGSWLHLIGPDAMLLVSAGILFVTGPSMALGFARIGARAPR